MKYRLGLDIGAASLGWSVLELDEDDKPQRVVNAGARIFSDGREDEGKITLATVRRVARSARRRRDRFLQRQRLLIAEMIEAGLLPKDAQERKGLQQKNPLQLRAEALSGKLAPHDIGRALFHINQRRGFKSNRKDTSEEVASGKVARSVKALTIEMGLAADDESEDSNHDWLKKLNENKQFSFGFFLWRRLSEENKPTRARSGAGKDGRLYDVFPTREIYLDEFNKIWEAQAAYHPAIMTPVRREKIERIIFYQRPLKKPEVGCCMYLPEERRAYRASPVFQRYRIYREVNNLEWRDGGNRKRRLRDNRAMRDAVIAMLERQAHKKPSKKPLSRKTEVKFKQIENYLRKKRYFDEGETVIFNFSTNREGFDANLTSHVMQHPDYVGAQWHEWDLQKQNTFIEIILDDELDDNEVQERLQSGEYGLTPQAAKKCANAALVEGSAAVSEKAAGLLLEKMQNGLIDEEGEVFLPTRDKALAALADEGIEGFRNPARKPKDEEGGYTPLPELPYYGKALVDKGHIIPGTGSMDDAGNDLKFYGGISNPTVHVALNQLRSVINELITRRRYGHPHSIAIKLGKELPEGAAYRSGIGKVQESNREHNLELGKELRDTFAVADNGANRLRLNLWRQQEKLCPYSGDRIGGGDLFSDAIEIDHILPFGITLDDSPANKVLCTRKANRDKGDRTPWQAFGHDPEGYRWEEIYQRAVNITVVEKRFNRRERKFEEQAFNNKLWRFEEDAMDRWETEAKDFLARHLNDTRYIGRLARDYLECICHADKINVVTGRVTALLRGHWGLNSVLQQDDKNLKNRDDYRHHAVDAVVIGMTDRSVLQKIATEADKGEAINSLFPKNKDGTSPIAPWPDFRNQVKQLIDGIYVSHRINRKKQGQLLKETAYGYVDEAKRQPLDQATADEAEKTALVVRKEIAGFKTRKHIEEIRDHSLRSGFLDAFDAADNIPGKKGTDGVLSLAKEKNIRHLRVIVNKTVQPIRDKQQHAYKAYALGNNWAVEIYQLPSEEEWRWFFISRFDACQKDFQPGVSKRPHPQAKLIMRLSNDDVLMITDERGKERLMRVHKMSEGNMLLCEHHAANIPGRVKELRDKKICYNCQSLDGAKGLKALYPRKAHISPTGLVRNL